jgi:hypothetical protein
MKGVIGAFLLVFTVFFSFTFVAGSEFVVDFYVDEPEAVVEDVLSGNFIWDNLGCLSLILFVLIVVYFIFKKNKARKVSGKKSKSLAKVKKKRKVSKKKSSVSAGLKKKR